MLIFPHCGIIRQRVAYFWPIVSTIRCNVCVYSDFWPSGVLWRIHPRWLKRCGIDGAARRRAVESVSCKFQSPPHLHVSRMKGRHSFFGWTNPTLDNTSLPLTHGPVTSRMTTPLFCDVNDCCALYLICKCLLRVARCIYLSHKGIYDLRSDVDARKLIFLNVLSDYFNSGMYAAPNSIYRVRFAIFKENEMHR